MDAEVLSKLCCGIRKKKPKAIGRPKAVKKTPKKKPTIFPPLLKSLMQ